jgi:hypothetical protein
MSNAVPLPAGSTLGKSFEYGIDVNLGTSAVPSWQPVRRISGFNPTPTPTTQDAQTYDDLGAQNNDVTGWSFGLAFNVQVNRSLTTGLYLPEVEAILARTKPSAKGELAVLEVRWYHKPELGTPNPTDAGRGLATVAVTRQNTGPNGEIEVLSVTLTGKGPYDEIANPFTGWDLTAPVIGSVTPEGAGDGDLVTITGTGFLGATAVSIDALPVTEFTVVNAASIIAVVPIGDAGDAPVVVTTPAGASAPFSFTRGA